jgi:hypothetical protein
MHERQFGGWSTSKHRGEPKLVNSVDGSHMIKPSEPRVGRIPSFTVEPLEHLITAPRSAAI